MSYRSNCPLSKPGIQRLDALGQWASSDQGSDSDVVMACCGVMRRHL
jgi:phosphoketolase